jgi:alkylated DNA repair dioxygenase AlkB
MKMIVNRPNLLPQDGIALYYDKIIDDDQVKQLYDALFDGIVWENERIVMFGKEYTAKRKVALYSDPSIAYRYAGKTKVGLPWIHPLIAAKEIVESVTEETYNACLLNLYHNGEESMGWHSDNEKEIISGSSIASLSLGASRKFSFKNKKTKETVSVELTDGSLLEMKGSAQVHWWHALPKSKKVTRARINLTFRQMHDER